MNRYGSLCDDFYINLNLSTEMELPSNRETILHFFEQVQKKYPTMRNFYTRDKGHFVLEEDKDRGQYRWVTVEPQRVCSGQVNPETIDDALSQHCLVAEVAPYALAVSPLDCEAMDLLFGFDFTYRGNHNQLVAEALGVNPAFESLAEQSGTSVITCEPSLTVSLDDECRLQCRLSVETRTNAYQIRTGEFPEEQLSVFVTARQYGSLESGTDYVATLRKLADICQDMVDQHVINQILQPLARAIAIK